MTNEVWAGIGVQVLITIVLVITAWATKRNADISAKNAEATFKMLETTITTYKESSVPKCGVTNTSLGRMKITNHGKGTMLNTYIHFTFDSEVLIIGLGDIHSEERRVLSLNNDIIGLAISLSDDVGLAIRNQMESNASWSWLMGIVYSHSCMGETTKIMNWYSVGADISNEIGGYIVSGIEPWLQRPVEIVPQEKYEKMGFRMMRDDSWKMV